MTAYQPPAPATVFQVAEGVLWIRMPLPFALDHINLWALEDGDGWTLVDTGVGDSITKELWEQLLAGPLAGKPVTRLICTHFHPDHMGLAGWFTQRFPIPLTATLAEWTTGRLAWLEIGPETLAHKVEHHRLAGFSPEQCAGVQSRGNTYHPRVTPPPSAFLRIRDGDRLSIGGRTWQVMACGGHSSEHACLWCPEIEVLISGDQILPRISPIVGVWHTEPKADPLSEFLAALERLSRLPETTLVLPSHGRPFKTLHHRAAELLAHHNLRLDEALAACTQPATVTEVLAALFPRALDPHHTAFALGESLAHLHYLRRQGKVVRETRGDGVWLFRRT